MRLSNDLREFLESLNSGGVNYVIVGAHSFAFHCRPRFTGDLDILLEATRANAKKMVALLGAFGFATSRFKESDFVEPGQVIQLGRAPNRIDLLTSISGIANTEVFATKVAAELDGIPVFMLSRDALIRNKRAVGRAQDLADLEALEE